MSDDIEREERGTKSADPQRTSVTQVPFRSIYKNEAFVKALDRALRLTPDSPDERVRLLLDEYRDLLGDDCDVQVLRFVGSKADQLELAEQIWSTSQSTVINGNRTALGEFAASAIKRFDPTDPDEPHQPRVVVLTSDLQGDDRQWFDRKRRQHLRPHGWKKVMLTTWWSGPKTLLSTLTYACEESFTFASEQRELAGCVIRAAGPMIDPDHFVDLRNLVSPSIARGNPRSGADRIAEARLRRDRASTRTPPGATPHTVPPDDERTEGERALDDAGELTNRQADVLRRLLRGSSEKEISNAMEITVNTVHSHVKNLHRRFDVSSRGELLALFIDRRVLARLDRAAI